MTVVFKEEIAAEELDAIYKSGMFLIYRMIKVVNGLDHIVDFAIRKTDGKKILIVREEVQ